MTTREFPIEKCSIRNEYQRDKDRIIHSKAFRRLTHKTQVFIAPKGDHYRTRLTHTLEVSQIARTIARGCNLDEDLTEAIALGHDLGHTPFGHTGEEALNEICSFRFLHNEQSLRVVTKIENQGKGLNLCFATRDGILNHKGGLKAKTHEGLIVNTADRIAYINHDIDDAIRANLLKNDDLPKESIEILGKTHSLRINKLVMEMIKYYNDNNEVDLYPETKKALLELRTFMFQNIYLNRTDKTDEEKAKGVVCRLFEFYMKNPEKIPKEYVDQQIERNACDYIAGMTDRYAIARFEEIFVPKGFVIAK